MDLVALWVQLGVAAAIIVGASLQLTKSADVIAIKTGLGRSFAGIVLLATATSLPELGTGVSSVAWVGEPDMAVGSAFGSSLFSLLIIGLLDVLWWNRYLLNHVGMSSVVVGTLGVGIISIVSIAVMLHVMTTSFGTWYLSPVSLMAVGLFFAAMFFIYNYEKKQDSNPSEYGGDDYANKRLSIGIIVYISSAAIVVGGAIWLSVVGDQLATELGWGASFMGTQFLAAVTSLPEVVTSIAALRLNAPEMAVTNLLGSNLFNMGFVLFADEIAYTQGTIWASVSPVHALAGVLAIAMTTVVLLAVVNRPRKERPTFITLEAVLLLGTYASASFLVFHFG